VFYINVTLGLFSLFMIWRYIWDPPYIRRPAGRVDAWGLGMLAVGMASLQIMLDKGQEEDWFSSPLIVILAILAIVGLTAFVVRELSIPDPIVHFRLFHFRTFTAGIVVVTILGFVLYGSLVLLPLFMQELLGWTAVTAGIWTSPRGIGTALCMPLVGWLLGKGFDGRWMLVFGFIVTAIAFFGYSHMNLESGTWDIFWHQINQGVGMAFVFVPLTTITMDPIPKQETGYATSLYSVMRNIGSSVGISFVTTWLARRSQFHQSVLVSKITPYNNAMQSAESGARELFLGQGSPHSLATQQGLAEIYGGDLRWSAAAGITAQLCRCFLAYGRAIPADNTAGFHHAAQPSRAQRCAGALNKTGVSGQRSAPKDCPMCA
jgi:DHA2 family multidrug resistance protein